MALVAAGASVAFLACGGGNAAPGVGSAMMPTGSRSETIAHEACEEKGHRVELLDSNNDGKPDIRVMYDNATNKEVCRVVDLNHDGRPDLYEYYDADHTLRRREFAFGEDGVINDIEFFENGKLVRRELDTTGQHKIDTWDFFDPNRSVDAKTGHAKPIRRERDTTGDGKVDQWWSWAPDGALTIAMDKTGDGRPDPGSALVIEAGAPPFDAAAANAPPPPPPLPVDEAGTNSGDASADGGTT